MDGVRSRRLASLGVLGLVLTTAVVTGAVSTGTVHAVNPNTITAPERLYITPNGAASIPAEIAAFVGVQQGELAFDGSTDPISQSVRTIAVEALTGDAGCDLTEAPYDDDDCPRLQIGPVNHGRLHIGPITTVPDGAGPGLDVNVLTNHNVRIDDVYQTADGSFTLGLNGEAADLTAALADLVYTPDPGYYDVGSNPEDIEFLLVPGNGDDNLPEPTEDNDSANHTIQVRVLDVNDFPTHEGPDAKSVQPGVELLMPAVADPPTPVDPVYPSAEFTVADPDNDEGLELDDLGNQDPDGPLPDGEDTDMMLIGWLECGQPIADDPNQAGPDHGFHFRGGDFQSDDIQIEDFFEVLYDVNANPDNQEIIDALVAALDAIDPDLKNITLATSFPSDYTTAFAGVGSIRDVAYALSQVSFRHAAPNDTCDLVTVVLDLGNNGLPLQYLGSPFPPDTGDPGPSDDVFGIEVPFLGFDWNVLTITTGEADEIDVSWDSPTYYIVEGDPGDPVLDIAPSLTVSPNDHPGASFTWAAAPSGANPATPPPSSNDYQGAQNGTVDIGAGITTYALDDTRIVNDDIDEGNETFTVTITPGLAPPGYTVVSATPTVTVTIIDDDDLPATVTSFADASASEGDPGDSNTIEFAIQLDKPADGGETVEVVLTPDSATSPADFGAPAPMTVVFAPGDQTATFDVPIVGDLLDEGDHSFTATLSSPPGGLTIGDPTAVGTIDDDDATRVLSIADVSIAEGDDPDTSGLVFTLLLDQPAKGTESLTVATSDVSASAGSDYVAVSQPVTFAAGVSSVPVSITINGDSAVEINETFELLLSSVSNLVAPSTPAVGTILDDDGDPPSVLDVADVTIDETSGTVSVAVSNSFPSRVCRIAVTTMDLTAFTPGDYTGITTDQFDADGIDTVDITIVDDVEVEVDETFLVALALTASSAPGCEIGDGEATVTIASDDQWADVSIADAVVTEATGDTDETTITMTNWVSGLECALLVTSSNDTAVAPGDYLAIGPGANFVLAAATDVLGLSIVDDALDDDAETFDVAIDLDDSADPRCRLLDGAATVTITDDDGPPDTTAPEVTIDQAAGQDDPTDASPILFTAVFSEPVTGFDGSDVLLAGTATPTTAVVTGSGTTYTVSVSGMSAGGTVIASVPSGAASDAASNTNEASTSTDNVVTYAPDVSAPLTIDLPDDIVVDNDPGEAGAAVTYAAATATGGVPPVSIVCDRASGAFYPIGQTVVTCTATDSEVGADVTEAVVSGSFTITVVDAEPPAIADVPDITRTATSSTGAAVTFDEPSATDNAGPPVVTCMPVSGSTFPIGTSTVTCTASDEAGNTASTSFTVTVTPPASTPPTTPPPTTPPPTTSPTSPTSPVGGLPPTGSGPAPALLFAATALLCGVVLRRSTARRARCGVNGV